MTSSPIVSGFNTVARALNTASTFIPGKASVQAVGSFVEKNFGADGFKTFVAKPIALVGQTLTFVKSYNDVNVMAAMAAGQRNAANEAACKDYPFTMKAAGMAGAAKTLISTFEVFTKLPKLLKELSTEVDGGSPERARGFCSTDNGYQNLGGLNWTPIETVGNRLFWLAGWIISLGDNIIFAKQCGQPLHPKIENATPWIYTIAGGFMGGQQLWSEVRIAKATWLDPSTKTVASEKWYGILSIATNVAYIFNSIMGAVGIYLGNNRNVPAWLGKAQFAASAGTIVLPAMQKAAKIYMENAVWV